MKFYDTHFDEYIKNNNHISLHPKLNKLYDEAFPIKINDLTNMIFYGPSGVGKYTQVLSLIKRYSPTQLKYEKKISVAFNKNTYLYKISDIHYEIDMSQLGCQSKMLWNEVYNTIVDIILIKSQNTGIIVCKYFHDIHPELLENFYSYMETKPSSLLDLKFIFITEQISFIPNNILNCCKIINVARPSRSLYTKYIHNQKYNKNMVLPDTTTIKNIKNILASIDQNITPYNKICDKIVNIIHNVNINPSSLELSASSSSASSSSFDFLLLREHLYDILIYNLDISECIWYILTNLITSKKINSIDIMSEILVKIYTFLFYYNNNYRPIYHLENLILFIIIKVHSIES
jgi:hypothetical protein